MSKMVRVFLISTSLIFLGFSYWQMYEIGYKRCDHEYKDAERKESDARTSRRIEELKEKYKNAPPPVMPKAED